MKTNDICSIIITYNRKELLRENIEAILKQTLKSDIFIFDNDSSDGTEEYLRDLGYLNMDNFEYFKNKSNIGGAGGFSKAMEMAYNKGYEFLYLMDDDGKMKNNNTLENLFNKYKSLNKPLTIINSLVVYNENNDMTFNVFKTNDFRKLIKNNLIEGNIMPFNGTLIPKCVIEKIGYPKAEFFIRGDEREYTARAKQMGVNLCVCTNSLYYHPKPKITYRKILFKNIIWADEQPWKKYYETRNTIYILKKYYSKSKLIKYIYSMYIKSFILYNKNLEVIKKAIKDGLNNDFSYKAHLDDKMKK